MFSTPTTAAILAAFSLGLAAPMASAAEAETQDQIVAQAETFDDEKLQSFALAAIQVQDIQAQYHAELQAATTEEEQQQVIVEAVDEMVAAVEEAPGITVEEYDAIIEAAATDPALADKLTEHMQQAIVQ